MDFIIAAVIVAGLIWAVLGAAALWTYYDLQQAKKIAPNPSPMPKEDERSA